MDESIIEKVKSLNLSEGIHKKIEVDGKLANVSKLGGSLVIATTSGIVSVVSEVINLN